MNDEGVCRTALATPGLLISIEYFFQFYYDKMLILFGEL